MIDTITVIAAGMWFMAVTDVAASGIGTAVGATSIAGGIIITIITGESAAVSTSTFGDF